MKSTQSAFGRSRNKGWQATGEDGCTAFSHLCPKCTNTTVPTAARDVQASVIFEARDMPTLIIVGNVLLVMKNVHSCGWSFFKAMTMLGVWPG